jgi:hypothetical protein
MDKYTVIKRITALADNQLKDQALAQELNSEINSNQRIRFYYEVQLLISRYLRRTVIMHPVPFDLRRKLIQVLSQVNSP